MYTKTVHAGKVGSAVAVACGTSSVGRGNGVGVWGKETIGARVGVGMGVETAVFGRKSHATRKNERRRRGK